ncbi:hypothetical protein NS226_17185 [Aureimonas ureilytica]|uniref:Uncharacterized protein n=1 Tax=Aureimonas ureilytica TaxID=401562 RepID=A0A175R4I7_9HYPH|nr:hypothetical protein [Aureimonas ureilytica]KTQ88771.1 hypothetical protein NS226_17185 [Aureimonas ureilytica]
MSSLILCRIRSLKLSAGGPSFFIGGAFQAKALSAVGVEHGDETLGLARDLQAGLLKGRDDLGAVAHEAVLDPPLDHRVDRLAIPSPLRGFQSDLTVARTGRVVGIGPTVFVVQGVLECPVEALPARGSDVEGAP